MEWASHENAMICSLISHTISEWHRGVPPALCEESTGVRVGVSKTRPAWVLIIGWYWFRQLEVFSSFQQWQL